MKIPLCTFIRNTVRTDSMIEIPLCTFIRDCTIIRHTRVKVGIFRSNHESDVGLFHSHLECPSRGWKFSQMLALHKHKKQPYISRGRFETWKKHMPRELREHHPTDRMQSTG